MSGCTFDAEYTAKVVGLAAGLKPEQLPGLAEILRLVYREGESDMRERVVAALKDWRDGSARLADLAERDEDSEARRTHRDDMHALAGAIVDVQNLTPLDLGPAPSHPPEPSP